MGPPATGLARGVSWSAAGQGGAELIRLGAGLALAAFLPPELFGRAGLASLLTGAVTVLSSLGLGSVLISRAEVDEEEHATAFVVNVTLATLAAAALAAAAPAVAALAGAPEVARLVRGFALVACVGAAGTVPRIRLHRALAFRTLAAVEVSAAGAGAAVSVGLATAGAGADALIAWYLTQAATTTAGAWLTAGFRPGRPSAAALRRMAPFASRVVGSETAGYLALHLDRLLVGVVLGDRALGLFDQATRLAVTPMTNLALVVSRVLFPALSRARAGGDGGAVWLDWAGLVAFVAAPLALGLAGASRAFVAVAYGPAWEALAPALAFAGPAGVAAAVSALAPAAFRAVEQPGVELRVRAGRQALGVAAAALALSGGLPAVLAARAFAALATLPWLHARLGGVLGLPPRAQLRVFAPTAALGAATGLTAALLDHALAGQVPDGVALAAEVAAGAAVYLGGAALVGHPSLRFARTLLP